MKGGNFVMPWGKYKGMRICDLPTEYLRYLAESVPEDTPINRKICYGADVEYRKRVEDNE